MIKSDEAKARGFVLTGDAVNDVEMLYKAILGPGRTPVARQHGCKDAVGWHDAGAGGQCVHGVRVRCRSTIWCRPAGISCCDIAVALRSLTKPSRRRCRRCSPGRPPCGGSGWQINVADRFALAWRVCSSAFGRASSPRDAPPFFAGFVHPLAPCDDGAPCRQENIPHDPNLSPPPSGNCSPGFLPSPCPSFGGCCRLPGAPWWKTPLAGRSRVCRAAQPGPALCPARISSIWR